MIEVLSEWLGHLHFFIQFSLHLRLRHSKSRAVSKFYLDLVCVTDQDTLTNPNFCGFCKSLVPEY